jgi:hypothetical protein
MYAQVSGKQLGQFHREDEGVPVVLLAVSIEHTPAGAVLFHGRIAGARLSSDRFGFSEVRVCRV